METLLQLFVVRMGCCSCFTLQMSFGRVVIGSVLYWTKPLQFFKEIRLISLLVTFYLNIVLYFQTTLLSTTTFSSVCFSSSWRPWIFLSSTYLYNNQEGFCTEPFFKDIDRVFLVYGYEIFKKVCNLLILSDPRVLGPLLLELLVEWEKGE